MRKLISAAVLSPLVLLSGFAQAQGIPDLKFEIALEKKKHVPREPIMVKSKVTNLSKAVLNLPEPSIGGEAITYEISIKEGDSFKVISPQILGMGLPGLARRVQLKPGQSWQESSELFHRFGTMDLTPGRYYIRAEYHLGNYATPEYLQKVVTAETELNIVKPNNNQKNERERLDNLKNEGDNPKKVAALWKFLDENPKSIFRTEALDELSQLEWEAKNWRGYLKVVRQQRNELIGDLHRRMLFYSEADALADLGEFEAAIKVLENSPLDDVTFEVRQLRRKMKAATQKQG